MAPTRRQTLLRLQGPGGASAILDDLSRHLRAVGIDVYQIDHEDANGQFLNQLHVRRGLEIGR